MKGSPFEGVVIGLSPIAGSSGQRKAWSKGFTKLCQFEIIDTKTDASRGTSSSMGLMKSRKRKLGQGVLERKKDKSGTDEGSLEPLRKYTHVVVGKDLDLAAAKKTLGLNEEQDLPNGTFLLNSEWLIACLQQKQRVPEEPYTVLAVGVGDGAVAASNDGQDLSDASMISGVAGAEDTEVDHAESRDGESKVKGKVRSDSCEDYLSDDSNGSDVVSLLPHLCQRRCPLKHHNMKLTALLDELISYYAAMPGPDNSNRFLGFSKAANVLRAMPFRCTSSRQIAGVDGISEATLTMIDEFNATGQITRLESMRKNQKAVAYKELRQIQGVGADKAAKWEQLGIRTVAQAKEALRHKKLEGVTEMIRNGLKYYDDFADSLNRRQAKEMADIVKSKLYETARAEGARLKDAEVKFDIVGGFRRGKTKMHDVDVVATVRLPDGSDGTFGLLNKLCRRLEKMDPPFLLERFNSQSGIFDKSSRGETVFHAHKHQVVLCICDFEGRKRRMDIILAPPSQYAFCLLGWTGNTMFGRSILTYAENVRNIRLSVQGMCYGPRKDAGSVNGLPVSGCLEGHFDTEEKIFQYLKLEYIPPTLRNC